MVQDDPPRPESDIIGIYKSPATTVYVASFDGFGVESNILAQAKALRDKLHEDGRRFDVRYYIHEMLQHTDCDTDLFLPDLSLIPPVPCSCLRCDVTGYFCIEQAVL